MRYILEGNNVIKKENPLEWALWILENNKVIEFTNSPLYKVKTIFLGLDMSTKAEGAPLLFKTFVLAPGTFLDCYAEYYTTYDEALEGHQRIVEKIKTLCR